MKTIFKLLFTTVILMAISCSQESVTDLTQENLTATDVKGKNATRAWRGKFTNVPDLNEPNISCVPEEAEVVLTTNIISGNMTHLGKIQPGSFGRPQEGTCFLTGPNSLRSIYEVNYIGAHGDVITTTEDVTIIIDFDADPSGQTGTFENTKDDDGNIIPIIIKEGTGRFAGATGHLVFVDAVFGPDGSSWELVGKIMY